MIAVGAALLALTGCTATDDPSPDAGQGPSSATPATPPGSAEATETAAPTELTPVLPLPAAVRAEVDDVAWTVLPDAHAGPPTATTSVPWVDFRGAPDYGTSVSMSSGQHTVPLRAATGSPDFPYLRVSAVWASGVVWSNGLGLYFTSWDGETTRIPAAKAGERAAFTADKVFFVNRDDLLSVTDGDLTARVEASAAELAGVDADRIAQATMAGVLPDNEPVVRVTYTDDAGQQVRGLYSLAHGYVPLPVAWTYTGGDVAVGYDVQADAWGAYDARTYQPLWSHVFVDGKRRLNLAMMAPIPGGGVVGLSANSALNTLLVEARTGKVVRLIKSPATWPIFEDDHHVVYEVYEGPPNPNADPGDAQPEVTEVTYPNVLIRCSLSNECEKVAEVEPLEHSLMTGITSYLFP